MKRILLIIFSMFLLLSLVMTSIMPCFTIENGKTYFYNDWLYTVNENGNACIEGYKGKALKLNIPDKIKGITVDSISETAFMNNKFEEITLSDTITDIGWWAFYGCSNLRKVNFGKRIKNISYGAFMNCSALCNVDLPMSVSKIGFDAFAVNCKTKKDYNDIYSHEIISKQYYTQTKDFVLSGYSGTCAEKYAGDNSLEFVSKGKIMYGDADLNGVVNHFDALLLQKYIDEETDFDEIQICNADVDNDLEITLNDKKLIEDYSLDKLSYYEFPVSKELYEVPDTLNGKRMYCDGDSVAWGTGTNVEGRSCYSFCNYVAEKFNMSFVNKAVPGTTIARRKNIPNESKISILERVLQMKGDYDVILLDGGFNDLFKKVDIGKITDLENKNGIYDEYTTAGALESICYFLNKNYKDSIKLFVLCHKRYTDKRQPEYWALIKSVLDKWDIPYVDLAEETELNDLSEELSNQYFRYKKGKGDGVHPLEYTNRKIYGPCVADKLCEIVTANSRFDITDTEITMGFIEKYKIEPEYYGNEQDCKIIWTSDDETIAVIDDNGLINAKGIGTTVIRAYNGFGKTYCIKVNVKLMAVNIELDKKSIIMKNNDTYELKVTVPEGTASLVNHFTTSNSKVAKVDETDGTITAISQGTAVITCHTLMGAKAQCMIIVKDDVLKTDI